MKKCMACSGAPLKRQKGISIIELMISLVISMAVVAGSVQVVVSSKRSFMDQDEVTFIQTNARYALDLLARDIRMAGYLGCASTGSVEIANSIVNNSGLADGYFSLQGIAGFDGDTGIAQFPTDIQALATAGTDSILVRRASDTGELNVSDHNAVAASISLWDSHEFKPGASLVIADASCRHVGLFQLSGPVSTPAQTISHKVSGAANNCTEVIKGDFACALTCTADACGDANRANGKYKPGSKVMAFIARNYFIGESSVIPGMPALKRQVYSPGATATLTEELAVGVEDMQIVYGVDSNNDGSVDQFRKASDMDLNNDGSITALEWDRALAVKLSLVFRSQKPVLQKAETKQFAGKTYSDRYIRQMVNSTLRVRNRG